MRHRVLLSLCFSFVLLSAGLYGKKKPKTPALPVVAQMSADQKVLHILNRLTFGARQIDIDELKGAGLDAWIDAQLHPETIAENPVLEAKLAPLDSLRLSTTELQRKYPSQQMVKAMMDGRMPLPADPATRAAVNGVINRYEQRKSGDAQSAAGLPLSEEQRAVFAKGTAEERIALLQTLPPDELLSVLEAMPVVMLARLAMVAPRDLRRRIQFLTSPCRW